MTLFPPSDAPRVFALPPGVDFSRALAKGLADRLSDAPSEALAGVTLALNTRRTARAVERAFEAERRATFLPRMRMLDDFARGAAGGPPAIQPLPRRLAMRRIVRDFLGARPGLGSLAATGGLADALISLLDELYREGLSPETLPEIKIDERHAAHWGLSKQFLDIIAALWPEILAEEQGAPIDPADRRRRQAEALIEAW